MLALEPGRLIFRWAALATLLLASGHAWAIIGPSSVGIPVPTYYTSPTGSGTACTSGSPCTLSQAQSSIQTYLAAHPGPTIQVCLGDNTYRITSPLSFGSADSDLPGRAVMWTDCNGPGHTAYIDGGVQVPPSSWALCTDAGVCNGGSAGIWKASVTSPSDFREAYFAGIHGKRSGTQT